MGYIEYLKTGDKRHLEPWQIELDKAIDAEYAGKKKAVVEDPEDGERVVVVEGDDADNDVHRLADTLVGMGLHEDRAHALDHILNTSRGAKTLERFSAAKRQEQPTMTMAQIIEKHGGILAIAKRIATVKDDAGFSEHDVTEAATREACKAFPALSSDRAFSKIL